MNKRFAYRWFLAVGCGALLSACSDLTLPEPEPAAQVEQTQESLFWGPPQAINLQFGDFAVHVPKNVRHVRGILLAIGGPNTQGFALGTPFGAPPPVEAELQDLGARLRSLAAKHGLAIIGSSRFGPNAYQNSPDSDKLLLDGIAEAARLTGRGELRHAPILLYGISGSGAEAAGFTQRHPRRVSGLFLKVPVAVEQFSGKALHVPVHMVLAENDAFVDNAQLTASFEAQRAVGGPWGMSVEKGVPHHSLSLAQREFTIDWMKVVLQRSHLGLFHHNPFWTGWLGNPATGKISLALLYRGDLRKASWFPSRPLASQWARFIGW